MTDQTKYTQKLKGAKVLVIGGSSGKSFVYCGVQYQAFRLTSLLGIGYAVAEASIENGCTVIISSSNPDRVQKAVQKIQTAYPSAKNRISGHACNLGDEATLESNIKQLFEKTGKGIDHVVSTAGDSLAMIKLEDLDIEKIKKAGEFILILTD